MFKAMDDIRDIVDKIWDIMTLNLVIKVVPYSENCLLFVFNGGSSSSLTICPIDILLKMNVLLSAKQPKS